MLAELFAAFLYVAAGCHVPRVVDVTLRGPKYDVACCLPYPGETNRRIYHNSKGTCVKLIELWRWHYILVVVSYRADGTMKERR